MVWLLGLALGLFLVALGYALAVGEFSQDGRALLDNPWGIMSLVDLYIGLLLFASFVLATEPNRLRALCWMIALMGLGNLVALLYVLRLLTKRSSGRQPDDLCRTE